MALETAATQRTNAGRFAPGHPGNPTGARPRASDSDAILRENAPRVARALVKQALAGDVLAAEAVLRLGLHPAQPQQAAA